MYQLVVVETLFIFLDYPVLWQKKYVNGWHCYKF